MTMQIKLLVVGSIAITSFLLSPSSSSAADDHYVCTQNGKWSFSEIQKTRSCFQLHNEPGWEDLISEPNIIVSYHRPSVVREGDTVKAWVQFYLATPVPDEGGRLRYDSIRATYKFYCKSRQQLMIQGTYKLGSARVSERSSNQSVLEEIEPSTIAETVLTKLCDDERNGPPPRNQPSGGNYEEAFVCPEALRDDAAREDELKNFMQWMANAHHEMNTLREIVGMRMKLLKANHCVKALQNMER